MCARGSERDRYGDDLLREPYEYRFPGSEHAMEIGQNTFLSTILERTQEIPHTFTVISERPNPRKIRYGIHRTGDSTQSCESSRTSTAKTAPPLHIRLAVRTAGREEKVNKHRKQMYPSGVYRSFYIITQFAKKCLRFPRDYDMINAEKRYIS